MRVRSRRSVAWKAAGRSRWVLFVLLPLVILVACGGGGSGRGGSTDDEVTPPGLTGEFFLSGTPAIPDGVRLVRGPAAGDRVTVDVVIGGPTASADIYSFAFDIVIETPEVARYVDGSAAIGSALDSAGCAGTEVLAQVQGDRVVIGVTKLGDCPGNAVVGGEEIIVSLTFEVMEVGVTRLRFDGPPGAEPRALDSDGGVIGTVVFDDESGAIRAL